MFLLGFLYASFISHLIRFFAFKVLLRAPLFTHAFAKHFSDCKQKIIFNFNKKKKQKLSFFFPLLIIAMETSHTCFLYRKLNIKTPAWCVLLINANSVILYYVSCLKSESLKDLSSVLDHLLNEAWNWKFKLLFVLQEFKLWSVVFEVKQPTKRPTIFNATKQYFPRNLFTPHFLRANA